MIKDYLFRPTGIVLVSLLILIISRIVIFILCSVCVYLPLFSHIRCSFDLSWISAYSLVCSPFYYIITYLDHSANHWKIMSAMNLLSFFLLTFPLVFSLQCYTFQTPDGAHTTNVQKTTVVCTFTNLAFVIFIMHFFQDCPITARFCVTSFQQSIDSVGNSMLLETRGCADDVLCHVSG